MITTARPRPGPGEPRAHGVGQSYKTHCPHGHAYTVANTKFQGATGWRCCRTCHREAQHRYLRARQR